MNEHLSFQELAAPLSQPGVLPDGVPLPIAIIATANPAVLAKASREVPSAHSEAAFEADPANTRILEQGYATLYKKVDQAIEADRKDAERAAEQQQTFLGMSGSLGHDVSAEDLQHMLELDDRSKELAAESADDNTHVRAAREEMIEAMASRANAQLDLPSLESQLRLRNEVERQVKHLGHAGWLASTAAGVILGTSAALGFTLLHDSPPAPPSASASEQALYKNRENMAEQVIIPAVSSILGGGIGFGIGARLQGRFARRRARSLMRKAGASL